MIFIVAVTLIRVYFSFIVMAYARQALQKYMQLMIMEGPGVDDYDGPFARDLPDGEADNGWSGNSNRQRKANEPGTLAGEV
ncbi:hypothetical protein NLG97_g5420 [Lecanicillium saksenae]|uniref:Uncharacterized protein n=1 Tax=Lecanicillium saksenae TaxID=468837 RepID=A0ACC1QU96_9HYPO|nr:hypothetical protein NLG97_g5420 [Lecanicillium saksenae]